MYANVQFQYIEYFWNPSIKYVDKYEHVDQMSKVLKFLDSRIDSFALAQWQCISVFFLIWFIEIVTWAVDIVYA